MVKLLYLFIGVKDIVSLILLFSVELKNKRGGCTPASALRVYVKSTRKQKLNYTLIRNSRSPVTQTQKCDKTVQISEFFGYPYIKLLKYSNRTYTGTSSSIYNNYFSISDKQGYGLLRLDKKKHLLCCQCNLP